MAKHTVGQEIWVEPDGNEGDYQLATVIHCEDQQFTVTIQSTREKKTLIHGEDNILEAEPNSVSVREVTDLAKLKGLHSPGVLHCLKSRFEKSSSYTNVGEDLLVMINPYRPEAVDDAAKRLGYFRTIQRPLLKRLDYIEPHIYTKCAKELYFMRDNPTKSSSFVVTGDAGSGKTETAKHILHFFTTQQNAWLQAKHSKSKDKDNEVELSPANQYIQGMERKVKSINTILEAFGSASTPRNLNTSRFTRFIKLFTEVDVVDDFPNPRVHGGEVNAFLLETTRLTTRDISERNYNVFYYMFRGGKLLQEHFGDGERDRDGVFKNRFKLDKCDHPLSSQREEGWTAYKLLSEPPGQGKGVAHDDTRQHEAFFNAMKTILGKNEIILDVYAVLAAIVHLGEIQFELDAKPKVGEEDFAHMKTIMPEAKDKNTRPPRPPHQLFLTVLGLTEENRGESLSKHRLNDVFDEWENFFSTRKTKDGEPNGRTIPEAQSVVNSTARFLYIKLFEWIVKKINDVIHVGHKDMKEAGAEVYRNKADGVMERYVGILDIMGFEALNTNTLDQFLINYGNERIQQIFTQTYFDAREKEMREEGLSLEAFAHRTNEKVVNVIHGDKDGKDGIFQTLNDICKTYDDFVRNRAKETEMDMHDDKFLEKLKDHSKLTEVFEPESGPRENTHFIVKHWMARDVKKFDQQASIHYAIDGFVRNNMYDGVDSRLISLLSCEGNTNEERMHGGVNAVLKEIVKEDKLSKKVKDWRLAEQYKKFIDTVVKNFVSPNDRVNFTRCIRPNSARAPADFNRTCVGPQMYASSIMDSLEMLNKGFPHKCDFLDFADEFSLLFLSKHLPIRLEQYRKGKNDPKLQTDLKETCKKMLTEFGGSVGYQIGTTKVFLSKNVYTTLCSEIDKTRDSTSNVGEYITRMSAVRHTKMEFTKGITRAKEIQAYMRSFREVALLRRTIHQKQCFWAVIAFTLRQRRFKRDRLAAFTIQAMIRELQAMTELTERMRRRKKRKAQKMVYVYLESVLAKREIQKKVEDIQKERMLDSVKVIADIYRKRQETMRQLNWQAFSRPIKRLVHYRIYLITKLQAFYRGRCVRRGKARGDQVLNNQGLIVAKRVAKYRALHKNLHDICCLKSHLKGVLIQRRFFDMYWAVEVAQHYSMRKFDRGNFLWRRHCTIRIQSAFRGWMTRSLISWQKLQVLYNAEMASVARMTQNTRKRLYDLCGCKPQSLVNVTCHMDLRLFYTEGWLKPYEDLIKRDGILKIQVGSEHTVVLGQNAVYSWGSDEVGQLGIGNVTDQQKNPDKVYGLCVPFFRYKVVDIACGRWHTIAQVEGKDPIYCWGLNHRGQCGIKSYMQGAAFTPSYPKMVRTPLSLAVLGPVLAIAAGPFHSAAILGETPLLYAWGEGSACGLQRDVRVPLQISSERVTAVALGDSFGFALSDQGLSAFGVRSSSLGIGVYPKRPRGGNPGISVNAPLIRFDTHHVADLRKDHYGKMHLVARPVPVRLPTTRVATIAAGDNHAIALCQGPVGLDAYEWGLRNVVRHDSCVDVGAVHLATPYKVDLQGCRARDVKASGNVTMIIVGMTNEMGHPVSAWDFLTTTARTDEMIPALYSYRLLRHASRAEMCSSVSLSTVYGYNTEWPEPNFERAMGLVESPQRSKGRQPRSQSLGSMSPQKKAPRQTLGKTIQSATGPVQSMRSQSPAFRGSTPPRLESPIRGDFSPKRQIGVMQGDYGLSPGHGAGAGSEPHVMKHRQVFGMAPAPSATPPRPTRARSPSPLSPRVGIQSILSSPPNVRIEPEQSPLINSRAAPSPSAHGRPVFYSPSFTAGRTNPPRMESPRMVTTTRTPRTPRPPSASPARTGSPGILATHTGTVSRKEYPKSPRVDFQSPRSRSASPERIQQRLEVLPHELVEALSSSPVAPGPGTSELKTKYIYEIQHLLRGQSTEELASLARRMRH